MLTLQNLIKVALETDNEEAETAMRHAVFVGITVLRQQSTALDELADELCACGEQPSEIDMDILKDKLALIAADLKLLP